MESPLWSLSPQVPRTHGDCPPLARCLPQGLHFCSSRTEGGYEAQTKKDLPALHPTPAGRRAPGDQCNPRKEQVGVREAESGVQLPQPPCCLPTARSSVMTAPGVLDDIDLEASVYARGLHGAASTM